MEVTMHSETRKLRLMEEVLSIKNDHVLDELESFLERIKPKKINHKPSAHDFSGIWSKEDAHLIEKAIEEGCEQINPDDWK